MQEEQKAPNMEGIQYTLLMCVLDLMREYNNILYKTSAQEVGLTADLAEKTSKHGHNGRFTKVILNIKLM